MRAVRSPFCSLPFRGLALRTLFATAVLLGYALPAQAQTYYGVTQSWCGKNGGQFRFTGKVGTDIGECVVLPRVGSGSSGSGGGYSGGGGNRYMDIYNAAGALRQMLAESRRREAIQLATDINEQGRQALSWGNYELAISYFEQSADLWGQLGDGGNVQISLNNAAIARNAWAEKDRQVRAAEERRQEAERQRLEDERRSAEEARRIAEAEAEAAARARQASSGQGASGGAARPAVKGARRDTNCTGPVPDDVAGCYEQPRLSKKQLAALEAERKRAERRAKRDQLREALRVKDKPVGDGGVVDDDDLQVTAADPPKPPEPPAKPPVMHWDHNIMQHECDARGGSWGTPKGRTMPGCLLDGPGRSGFPLAGPETDAFIKEQVDEHMKRVQEQSKTLRDNLFQRNQDALRRAQQAGKVGP